MVGYPVKQIDKDLFLKKVQNVLVVGSKRSSVV